MAEIDLNVASTANIDGTAEASPDHMNYSRMCQYLAEIKSRQFGWDGQHALPLRQDSDAELERFVQCSRHTMNWGNVEISAAIMDESGVPVMVFQSPINRKQVRLIFPCADIILWSKIWQESQIEGIIRCDGGRLYSELQALFDWANKSIIAP